MPPRSRPCWRPYGPWRDHYPPRSDGAGRRPACGLPQGHGCARRAGGRVPEREPLCGNHLRLSIQARGADRVKILAFDGTGLILATKRLEEGRFTWPPIQGGVIRLTAAQFSMLVDGLDWTRVSPRPVRRPLRVG